MKPIRPRRAVILIDMMIALAMAFMLLIALTYSLASLHRGERELAVKRAGERRLEDALLALQAGVPVEKEITIERLPDAAVAGKAWVKVSLPDTETVSLRRLSLTGLAPASQLPAGGTP